MILYVDDEPINLRLFELMFKSQYEVITASSGPEALEIIKNCDDIKLVVTDMKMPRMNGIEFVNKAKEIKNQIPYFLLSGYGLNEEINNALNKKVLNGYFQKPLNRDKLKCEFEKYY